jgi:hypothetical protein
MVRRVCLIILLGLWGILAVPPRREAGAAGRKFALFVGVNQYNASPLHGCVNDAVGMREMLVGKFGFNPAASPLLTDRSATRNSILGSIDRFVEASAAGDLFVFYYSGHGTLFPDHRSAEQDEAEVLNLSSLRARNMNIPDGRYDSALVPVDAAEISERSWRNLILDDELFARFSRMTAKGAFVILISDSCHSGTLARDIDVEGTPKYLDSETALGVKLDELTTPSGAAKTAPYEMHGRYLALTSSQDSQTSIDGMYESHPQGLFTYAIRKVISEGGSLDYQTLYGRSRELVRSYSRGLQLPHIDARFYRGQFTSPIFNAPAQQAQPAQQNRYARIRLTMRSRSGAPLTAGSFALFKPDAPAIPKQIQASNTLILLRTDENGRATGDLLNAVDGEYWIKAVCVGYRSYTGRLRLVEKNGEFLVSIELEPE